MKMVWFVFVASLAAFEVVWGDRFYSSLTHIGHDFAYAAITAMEGRAWLDSNGWIAGWFSPPWFTPAMCAGTGFFADPQSTFYSTHQLLVTAFDPFMATHLNMLLFAAVAFWGSYALARKVFLWEQGGAAIFGVLGMANAFLPMRSAVGEPGYHSFYVWTLLALAICWPAKDAGRKRAMIYPSIAVGLCLTVWLQAGFAGMMIPAFLAALTVCLGAVLAGRISMWLIFVRSVLGVVCALVLNASKLFESVSYMRNFPRDFYSIPGFPSLVDALTTSLLSLLLPSQWTSFFGVRRMLGVQYAALPHEWAMQFGLGALGMSLIALMGVVYLRRNESMAASQRVNWSVDKVLAIAALAVVFMIPVLVLWNIQEVRAILKSIPVLSSTTWPMRWIVIFLPLAQWLLAMPARSLLRRMSARYVPWAMIALTTVIWVGPFTEPLEFYTTNAVQFYDPNPVLNAYREARKHGHIPITRIAVRPEQSMPPSRNDTMLAGESQAICYNPIYGYRLEAFPQDARLADGPPLNLDKVGNSQIMNPACLVHPKENGCVPGDGFKIKDPFQEEQAKLFVNRKPFAWNRPALGVALSWLTQLAWAALALALAGWLVLAARRRFQRRRG